MKSHEQDQVALALCIYRDACAKCTVQPDLRDEMTISSRVEREGLSFLTITLPQFGKDLEYGLAAGALDSKAFRSFRKVRAIPAFLQGMLSQIFDQETGELKDEKLCIPAIGSVRQVAFAFKKLEMDCTPKREQAVLEAFRQVEHDLSEATLSDDDVTRFCNVGRVIWNCLSDICVTELTPKHGPGATAERIYGNSKYRWQYWYNRIEPYFPLLGSGYTVSAYGSEEFDDVTIIQEDEEKPVKVTLVPKTQKGPRVIAIEPCCMQYVQQSVRSELYDVLERAHITKGHINFRDQSVNRGLALAASKDELLATMDLSEASDRVINDLASHMFDSNPDLRDAIQACRSTHAFLPGGTLIGPMKKFASMGSALCFPVEAMYFYTICVLALIESRKLPVTYASCYKVSRDVYVYGDDIIVPRKWAVVVADYLHKYHCKVNMSKSFWNGKFRESCGMDAYDGIDVTPTYVRKERPSDKRQGGALVSWIKTANLFQGRGYGLTAAYMMKVCERILGHLPTVSDTSSALGRILEQRWWTPEIGRNLRKGIRSRWNAKIQVKEILAWTAEPVYDTDELEGYGALMKCLLSLERYAVPLQFHYENGIFSSSAIQVNPEGVSKYDEELDTSYKLSSHLARSARHGIVTLKRRWVAA